MQDPGGRDEQLRRMRRLATALLVAVAVVYAAAAALEARYPWLRYVAATAEAAMVGAIADWFAVVALFRHPLGLGFIPHTAIIPRNKRRIARGISDFIQQHFLSADAVMQRIAAFRPARSIAGWITRPGNAGMLSGYATRLIAFGLTLIDDERVRGVLREAASARLREVDFSSAAGRLLALLTESGRHHELLDAALAGLDELLARDDTRAMIAREVAANAPLAKAISDLFRLRLDERAALRIVDIAIRKLSEIRADRSHELRLKFDEAVGRFVARLKEDPALRERVEALRDEVLRSPALAEYVDGLWSALRTWLSADLARADSVVHARLAQAAGSLGRSLADNAGMLEWIDRQILEALPPLVDEHRAGIGRFIEDQVNGWQEHKLVAELERHLGPDLQYIRINGTLVGGLAGLAIALLTELLRG